MGAARGVFGHDSSNRFNYFSMLQQDYKMKKPVEIWQAVVATLLLLLTMISIIVNQSNRITRDEGQILNLQQNKSENDKHFEDVNTNLREMNTQLTSIRVLLEDKADRGK
jgi:hypothetical protein